MISVIIPLYNAERFIRETIESIQAQTYDKWECVVVDDGSTDNSATIVKEIASVDSRIRYVDQVNSGPSAARNNGLRLAKGEYIQFLDADDWFPPKRFEIMLNVYQDVNENVILYSGLCLGHEDDISNHLPYSKKTNAGLIDFKRMYAGFGNDFAFIPGAIMFRREHLTDISWKEDMRASEDWDYYLQLTQKGLNFLNVNECLFVYRYVENSLSSHSNAIHKANWHILNNYYRPSLMSSYLLRVTGCVYANLLHFKHKRKQLINFPPLNVKVLLGYILQPLLLPIYYLQRR